LNKSFFEDVMQNFYKPEKPIADNVTFENTLALNAMTTFFLN